jgi:tRNA (guanine-N7-)-methyltransferase
MREVLSYSRRGNRFTPHQQEAWDAHHDEWVIPEVAVDEAGFRLADWFGREAPLIVEIGSGVGEATGVLAAARPAYDVLALEVWRPGIAASLAEVAAAGAIHVRFCSVDAVWTMEHVVAAGGLAELWTFFPDPWPKTRHHKRRIVDPSFAALVTSRLAPGARWRLATDWADYAAQMQTVLDAEPGLTGGVVSRWGERPMTKFERKGVEAGRSITDLCYTRV